VTDLTTIGHRLPSDGKEGRDAIHIAITPMVAGERLVPGQRVTMRADPGARFTAVPASGDKGIGIVDPFLDLNTVIWPGDRFWLFLHPGSITSLRHEWTHPAFGPPATAADEGAFLDEQEARKEVRVKRAVDVSEQWLRRFASDIGETYETLMVGANKYADNGEALYVGEHAVDDFDDTFWDHYEIVTGRSVDPVLRGNFFQCGC
jgi:hypothetical protein